MSEHQTVTTSCKLCKFAIYQGKTQTGCHQERTEVFRERGELVEAYDEEKEFFVVRGRVCNTFRHSAAESPTEDFPLQQQQQTRLRLLLLDNLWNETRRQAIVVRQQVAIKMDAVVLFNASSELADLQKTLDSVRRQWKKQFAGIRVVNNQSGISRAELSVLLRDRAGDLSWSLTHLMEPAGRERAVELAFPSVRSAYYAVFAAGYQIPSNFVKLLDETLNDRLVPFCVVEPNEQGEGMVVQARLHRWPEFNGHRPIQVVPANEDDSPDEAKAYWLNTTVEKARHFGPSHVLTWEQVGQPTEKKCVT